MANLFDLTGRRALITGSSRGIGRELARGLAQHGASVVVHGRDAGTLDHVRKDIAARTGADVAAITFDVTDADQVDAAIDRLERDGGPIDILVNNAGIQRRAFFPDFELDDWHDLVATNLTSAFLVGRRVSRGMVERGAGKIINIGSVQSQLGRANIAPYAATKGGIAMLTKGMCADLGPRGIQVNALAPGYFATELTRALVDDVDFSRWVSERTPAGRWGRTEELVGTLVYLASGASDFVNGQVIYVDGGMTAVV
ncbi:SDR family oxidoreductase [Planctomonas psychrotolerans]|uniref:SDR family oxidoreductase n=1 Tax=Planctomonas psychrotolerans TaxID=2528712 RepID=UPI0012387C12|nr:SDR family oxidoreductase [Planctomonas psychrotolerans]